LDSYVIFTKSSSQKTNENSLLKKSFLGPNSSSKQLFNQTPIRVKVAKLVQKALFYQKAHTIKHPIDYDGNSRRGGHHSIAFGHNSYSPLSLSKLVPA